ncbi:MAG: DUF1573 domain-containing protein [Putridiphycobacter sp.]
MKFKQILGLAIPFSLLVACGSETESENNASSSIIAVENPTGDDAQVNMSNEKSENSGPTTNIKFKEDLFDFGTVVYPSENQHTFTFTNTGNSPLTIVSAKASCGCTIPNKPEEPIMPGETGEIDVIFRPKEGQQGQKVTKRVTVVANTVPKETYINISANVLKGMQVGN